MKIRRIGQINGGQDGTIYNGYLFSLDHKGICSVYRTKDLSEESVPVSQFVLDKAEQIVPHSNSVSFGNARYHEDDEFPLLYSNIYNNYAKEENKRIGTTCVYRLQRNGEQFSTELIQLIEIGFTEDKLWRSENTDDMRPYGNFAIDCDNSIYYAYTMLDEENCTRYFSFDLPKMTDGVYDEILGVKRVVLQKDDIKDFFDCPYHRFIQGSCFRDGILYSLEGFTHSCEQNPPAVRRIDVKAKKQMDIHRFADYGYPIETELIAFDHDVCYYANGHGNLFELTF